MTEQEKEQFKNCKVGDFITVWGDDHVVVGVEDHMVYTREVRKDGYQFDRNDLDQYD